MGGNPAVRVRFTLMREMCTFMARGFLKLLDRRDEEKARRREESERHESTAAPDLR